MPILKANYYIDEFIDVLKDNFDFELELINEFYDNTSYFKIENLKISFFFLKKQNWQINFKSIRASIHFCSCYNDGENKASIGGWFQTIMDCVFRNFIRNFIL